MREVKGEVMGEVMAKVKAEVGREHRPGADARGPCIVYEDERMAMERGTWNGKYNELEFFVSKQPETFLPSCFCSIHRRHGG